MDASTTVVMTLTRPERAVLDRMLARPAEPGATEGPLRIEEVRDLDAGDTDLVVEVRFANPSGRGEDARLLEQQLRRRMAEVDATGAVGD